MTHRDYWILGVRMFVVLVWAWAGGEKGGAAHVLGPQPNLYEQVHSNSSLISPGGVGREQHVCGSGVGWQGRRRLMRLGRWAVT